MTSTSMMVLSKPAALHARPDWAHMIPPMQVVNRLRKAHVQNIIRDFGPGVQDFEGHWHTFDVDLATQHTPVADLHLSALRRLLPCRV